MTTYTRRSEFAYLSRITKHGTKYAACAGITNRVLITERASGGGVTYQGQSEELLAEPLAIVSNGTPSAYYVLTELGVTVLSAAAAPVISAEYTFDTGAHPWLCYTASARLLAPLANGGLRLMTTAGVVLAELCGVVSESTFAVLDGTVLYLFDGKRGRLASITVGASSLTYEGQIAAPNCREVLRAVVDGDNLYCLNRHRVVRFDIATALEPEFAEDYGLKSVTYTDIAIIGSDRVWLGFAESTTSLTGDEFFGPVIGCWNSTNAELNSSAPQMSAWTVDDVVPYWGEDTVGDAGSSGTDGEPPHEVLPAAPVITSSLTEAATYGAAWTYTITATGAAPITFGVTNPPAWLTSIDPLTGAIGGTPNVGGLVNISITATNAGGTTTATLALTVSAAPAAPVIVSIVATPSTAGYVAGNVTMTATISYDGLSGPLIYDWEPYDIGPGAPSIVDDTVNPAVYDFNSGCIPAVYQDSGFGLTVSTTLNGFSTSAALPDFEVT